MEEKKTASLFWGFACRFLANTHTHAHITHHKFLQLLPTAHGGIGRCPVKATRPPSNFNYLPFRSCVVQLRHFSPKSCKLTPIGASANFWMRFVFFPSRSNSNFRQSVLTNTPFGFVSSPSSLVGSDSLHQPTPPPPPTPPPLCQLDLRCHNREQLEFTLRGVQLSMCWQAHAYTGTGVVASPPQLNIL